jgi:hypothetical protein
MDSLLLRLTGPEYAEARGRRGELADIALAERNAALLASGLPPLPSVDAYAARLAGRCVCLTLLAGSGSRWVKSLAAAAARGDSAEAKPSSFDPAKPRGLFPVRDFLLGGERLPIAAYALAAVDGLGRHLLVVRGWENEIEAEILRPLGIGRADRDFFTQEAAFGKPLGHGDAVWQCRSLWKGADYVITNFGGDANSRLSILSSLLALDALRATGAGAELLIPAAHQESPAYPIRLDEAGLPRGFGHAKLQGTSVAAGPAASGYTNVGVRIYSASALLERVESFRRRFWIEGQGYAIPGNDPEGHEFALDNVDAELAAEGRARILALGQTEELTPAKSVEDIPAFEDAMRRVIDSETKLRQRKD